MEIIDKSSCSDLCFLRTKKKFKEEAEDRIHDRECKCLEAEE